jgi:hypothetical protein
MVHNRYAATAQVPADIERIGPVGRPARSTKSVVASANERSAKQRSDRKFVCGCRSTTPAAKSTQGSGRCRRSTAYAAKMYAAKIRKYESRIKRPTTTGSLEPASHWWPATMSGSSGGYWFASMSPGSFRSQ